MWSDTNRRGNNRPRNRLRLLPVESACSDRTGFRVGSKPDALSIIQISAVVRMCMIQEASDKTVVLPASSSVIRIKHICSVLNTNQTYLGEISLIRNRPNMPRKLTKMIVFSQFDQFSVVFEHLLPSLNCFSSHEPGWNEYRFPHEYHTLTTAIIGFHAKVYSQTILTYCSCLWFALSNAYFALFQAGYTENNPRLLDKDRKLIKGGKTCPVNSS